MEVEICKKDGGNVEPFEPLYDKALNGFRELLRYLDYKEISSAALLSSAIAGVAKGKIIICLPDSTNACKLAMKNLILLELSYMVYEINR